MHRLLEENKSITCFVLKEDDILFTSKARGVKPLMDFYKEQGRVDGVYVVDRIMGKGAILLAILIGAKTAETPIISEPALELAQRHHFNVKYDKIVPHIINRAGDGQCPIESSLEGITDIEQGFETIKTTLKQLMAK